MRVSITDANNLFSCVGCTVVALAWIFFWALRAAFRPNIFPRGRRRR